MLLCWVAATLGFTCAALLAMPHWSRWVYFAVVVVLCGWLAAWALLEGGARCGM